MNEKNHGGTDLQHFLKLALAQLKHRIATLRASEGTYSTEMRRLLLLEELLKEQVVSK